MHVHVSVIFQNGFVTIVVSSQPITGGSIIIARQTGIFSMDCGGAPPPAPVVTKEGGRWLLLTFVSFQMHCDESAFCIFVK